MHEEVVIIPAYMPDEALVDIVKALTKQGLSVLVVDDGSGEQYSHILDKIRPMAQVVANPKNLGKGAALKRGMSELLLLYPECARVITADADGQHRTSDILRVREALRGGADFVLTVRDLSGDIPALSRIGNDLSRFVYTVFTGHYLRDNQSGLRGFCVRHVDWMKDVGGEKYDFEINMLYHADKQGVRITTLPIDTVYIDGNSATHFRPVEDTLLIYRRLFSSAWVSFVSFALSQALALVLTLTLSLDLCLLTVPAVGIVTALCSLLLNRFIAFRKTGFGDGARQFAFIMARYLVYTLGVFAASLFCELPLILALDALMLLLVPIEYLIRRSVYSRRA